MVRVPRRGMGTKSVLSENGFQEQAKQKKERNRKETERQRKTEREERQKDREKERKIGGCHRGQRESVTVPRDSVSREKKQVKQPS